MIVSIHAPVKVRLQKSYNTLKLKGFNSRTCEGATGSRERRNQGIRVSIHAPVKVRRKKR